MKHHVKSPGLDQGELWELWPQKKGGQIGQPQKCPQTWLQRSNSNSLAASSLPFFGTLNPAQWIPVSIYLPAYMVVS